MSMPRLRARLLRLLIWPVNWHRAGECRFPVLCMYDDLLIAEIEGFGHARWRHARSLRRRLDEEWQRILR